METLKTHILLVLILSSGFYEMEAKKHTRRQTFLLKSQNYRQNSQAKPTVVHRKATVLTIKKAQISSKTKFVDTFLLPLVILNTGVQLITTIVNIGVKHQEQHLKNLKEKQLKRLYAFKSRADSIKRGTCLSIIRVVSMFGDFFDWLRIEMFAIQIEESEKAPQNMIMGDYIYNEALTEEQKDEEENKIIVQNQSKFCVTKECMSQVLKVNSIKTIINSLRNSKNQILDFQNTFCDLGEDLIGEEKYYNARTMGILESIYPKKSESNASKYLMKAWEGFNDIFGIFEEVVWINQGIMDSYLKSEANLTAEMDKATQDPEKIKKLQEKLANAKAGFDSNDLISDTINQYLPNEFHKKEKTWSTFYVRHVLVGNPVYKSIGSLNSMKKNFWTKMKIMTGFQKLPDAELGNKTVPTRIQKALLAFEILQILFPFLLFFTLVMSFGFEGGSKLLNNFFSIFAFLNLFGEFFAYGSAMLTIACLKEKLDPKNTNYTSSPNYAHIKKELEKNIAENKKKMWKSIRGIIWYGFLLIFPFGFHAGLKWLMRNAAKAGKEAAVSLMNGLQTGVLSFKLLKNVVMLILAVRKYYDLKSRVEKITAEEDIEMKVRTNYLGNLSVQLQYVFIKFNLVIYNGLSGFLTSFRTVIKDGNPILKGTIEEESFDSPFYKKRAESLFGPDYEKLPGEFEARVESAIPKIAQFKDADGLKRTDFKDYLIIRYMPRQHFLMNLATENVDLVYRYKKYILNKFYNEKNTKANFLENFKAQFNKFLNKLFFTAPIANPMIFKLSSFADSSSLLQYSDLNIMKHNTFPDDYVCIYQKSFYSNSYLRGVKSYRFQLSGKLDQYNQFFESVEKIKSDKNLTDIYYMNNDEDGFIYAVVFVSWNTQKLLSIENFKIARPSGNEIVFMNKLLGRDSTIKMMPNFSEEFYDPEDEDYNNKAALEIDLVSFQIQGNDPFAPFYSSFMIQQENPIPKTDNPEFGEKTVSCSNPFVFSFYYINCRPDKEDFKSTDNVSGYNKLVLCGSAETNKQSPNDKRKNVMKRFVLPNPEKDECDSSFAILGPVVEEKNDTDEMNLILDLKTRSVKSEEDKKNDPAKHIKDGDNALEDTVNSLSLDIRETACKQITRLKHVIYGCYTDLIARKSEFGYFYEVKGDVSQFKKFYMDNFIKEKKLVQPTLSQFREKFHSYIVEKCDLGSTQNTKENMRDYTAFGFLYGHSEKPEDIDNFSAMNKKLKEIDRKMKMKSLKGKHLFAALESDKECFEKLIVNTERRFIFPLVKHDRDNSLVFTVYFILPYKKETKEQIDSYKVQSVYTLQDTNENFLNKYSTLKESEESSIVRGLTMGTDVETKDTSTELDKPEDGTSYTKRMAKLNMGPESLFKVFEYYYVEVWSSFSKDKDSAMHLVDENGVIEGLVDTGFVPFWPRTVPVITNDGSFKRNYDNLQYYYKGIKPTLDGEPDAVDYLEHYEEFSASSDFFFFFQYNEGNWFGKTFFESRLIGKKEKVIAYRLWVKYDFDTSKVEMELECPAQE